MNEFDKSSQEYLVFRCSSCEQYTYVKSTQKNKKCPRCGRNHRVSNLKGELVHGPAKAMQLVKKLQNSTYSINTFTSTKSPITLSFRSSTKSTLPPAIFSNSQFLKLFEKIVEWQKNEGITFQVGFPEYMLDYIAQEIEPDIKKRARLIQELIQLEQFTRLSSGNVYIEE